MRDRWRIFAGRRRWETVCVLWRYVGGARLREPGRREQGNGGRLTVVKTLVVAVVILTAGCANGSRPSDSTRTTPPGGSGATTQAPPLLSTRLVLDSTTVKAGGVLSGHIAIENNTGRPVVASGCGSIFQVLLTSRTYQPSAVWPTCVQAITIPTGPSSNPVSVQARYNACSQSGPSGTLPACTPTGSPPLPIGDYEATTFESGNALPVPAAVAVRVTP